jgi:hypothetical protein
VELVWVAARDSLAQISLTFRLPDSRRDVAVPLELETFRPLIGELRLTRPDLAARIEAAGRAAGSPIIALRDGDLEALAVAARLLRESQLVTDPALQQLAALCHPK